MPRPDRRVIGCPNAATEFPQIIMVGLMPAGDAAGTVPLCDSHYDQYQAQQLDLDRIGVPQAIY
jgi:hypothetical protein